MSAVNMATQVGSSLANNTLTGFTVAMSFGGAILAQAAEAPAASAVTVFLSLVGFASLLARLHYSRLRDLTHIEELRSRLLERTEELRETKSELRSLRGINEGRPRRADAATGDESPGDESPEAL